MTLYSENENYKLYQGNMLDMLEAIDPESIDSIVTDPPYELGFMGKSWDGSGVAFQKESWERCYKVLKSGGYLLAFGGSRTFHRIACAIEDAGFEIRDTIMWLYGCLSEDTEVLTKSGFKQFHKITEDDIIRVYDTKSRVYKWEKPKKWNIYKTEQDTCYRIKSDSTDQLVSRNHRCLIERDGELVFEFAENLNSVERVPVLSYNIPYLQKGNRFILLKDLLWQDERLAKELFSQWIREEKPKEITLWGNKPKLERWCDLSEKERELCQSENKVCPVSERVYSDGEKRWLCDGTQTISSTADRQTFIKNRGCSSYQSQCRGQSVRESNVICNEQRPQTVRKWETYTTTLATVTEEKYTGYLYCPTVSTGCFVARRNGKVFITGNSGFPKSMNIGLAIDKTDTKDFRKQIGNVIRQARINKNMTMDELCQKLELNNEGHGGMVNHYENGRATPTVELWNKICEILDIKDINDYEENKKGRCKIVGEIENPITWFGNGLKKEATTDLAKQWQGWGTALKPAYEPIIVARKPFKGSCVDNVLKYGVGGINIDECRIELEDGYVFKETNRHSRQNNVFTDDSCGFDSENNHTASASPDGRFPANVVLTYDESDFEEVCGGFPTRKTPNGSINNPNLKNSLGNGGIYNKYSEKQPLWESYNDSGSASRYFYCAKASKKDRDEGLDGFEEKTKIYNGKSSESSKEMKDVEERFTTKLKNTHPTVKPTSLMQYLVRLVTPNGGTVLDPFNGSGSTGKAVMYENAERNKGYKYIGIELTEEYLPIAKARIENINVQPKKELTLFEGVV